MLYDPKWDNIPSVEGFLRFCESKPPDEEYDWIDGSKCACAQYYQSIGRRVEWAMRIKWDYRHLTWTLDGVAQRCYPPTFGALVESLATDQLAGRI